MCGKANASTHKQAKEETQAEEEAEEEMTSPNTLIKQFKNDPSFDLYPRAILFGKPNYEKRAQRRLKALKQGNTRGKRRIP